MSHEQSQVHCQQFRVHRKGDAILPPSSEPEEVVCILTYFDKSIGKYVVLWEDILLAFTGIKHIRDGAYIVTFLRDDDLRKAAYTRAYSLEPLRILANEEAIFDVILKDNAEPRYSSTEVPGNSEHIPFSPSTSHLDSLLQGEETNINLNLTTSTVALEDMSSQVEDISDENERSVITNNIDINSHYEMGLKYDEGRGVPQDYNRAMKNYIVAAEMDSRAQFKIGRLYNFGNGVPKNNSKAMEWYLKAAEQGNASAQNNIGSLYRNGDGVPQDYSIAMEWFLKAAEQGNVNAQYNIGLMYRDGDGVSQDYSKAMEWFLKAAEQGNVKAQYNIGIMYRNGEGVPQDYSKAME
ncbi:hypothetical protein BGZ76_000973, partial [Entomortierella beljakovae]